MTTKRPALFSDNLARDAGETRIGTVIGGPFLGRVDVQVAGGEILRRVPLSGAAVAGDVVRLVYEAGDYIAQGTRPGDGVTGAGVVVGAGGGGSGNIPNPHDLLGSNHTLPSLSANSFLASPSGTAGLPSFRAIVPTDLPGGFAGFASPSAQIGMSAIAGASPYAMRADAAPAINPAITPTWTGLHTFGAGAKIDAGQSLYFGADVTLARLGANVLGLGSGDSYQSTGFVSGVTGWNITGDGDAEFNNIQARGELRAFVFKINELSATAGTFGVFYSAATANADFTTAASVGGSFTLQAKNSDAGGMLFGVGDICRVKAWNGSGLVDAWFTITARTNNTTYTSYTATLNSGSTSTVIREGSAIVDYGPSGTGFITLSADGTVGSSPNLTMATHAGSPWSGLTPLLRIGNLNGFGSYASNVYGVAMGNPAGAWHTWDTTNGIRILSVNNVVAQWDASGNITIGRVGASLANTYISAGEIQFRTNTTSYFKIAADGRVVFTQGAASTSAINWEMAGGGATVATMLGYRDAGAARSYASIVSYGYSSTAGITELTAYSYNNASGYARLWVDGANLRIVADNSFVANGGISTAGLTSSAAISATGNVSATGAMYASNWFRTFGDCGWYSETYGGGIYMIDTTWVRTYNSKSFYSGGRIQAAGGISSCYTMTGQVTASATAYGAFLVPAERDVTVSQWTMNVYIQTTNNGSNYWQFDLKRLSDGALIDSWNTSGWAANTWGRSARALSSAITASSHLGVYVDIIKIGSPGAVQCVSMLYMQ